MLLITLQAYLVMVQLQAKITCLDHIAVSEISMLIPGLGVVTGDWVAAGLGEYAGDLGLPAGLGLLAGLGEYTGDLGLPASHVVSKTHITSHIPRHIMT